MAARHYIIYIPGLSDTGLNRFMQESAVFAWRFRFNVITETATVGWADTTGLDTKLNHLLGHIDAAARRGYTVSLVAASAGASMATIAFAARKDVIHRVVVIVGALGPVEDASPLTLAANPILKQTLEQQPAAIALLSARERSRTLSIKALKDRVVPLRDMNIQGIQYAKLSTKSHVASIAKALTINSHIIFDFIKRRP